MLLLVLPLSPTTNMGKRYTETYLTMEHSNSSTEQSFDIDLEKTSNTKTELKVSTEAIEVPEGTLPGWMTCAASFLFNCTTWGSNAAYSIYLAHYLKEGLFEGATKLDYAAVGGIAFGAGLNAAPFIRFCVNKTSVRKTIAFGGVLQLVGILLAAFSTELWQIYLTQGVMIGYSLGFIGIPSMTLVAQWFRKRRSLAMAISASGSGVGGVVFNVAIQAALKSLGLRWAMIIQGIMCTIFTIVGLLLVRTRETQIKSVLKIWDWKMLFQPIYLIFATFVFTCLLGYVVLMYNLADFTLSLGYTAHQGSIVACMISVGIVIGRPIVGKLADMFGPVTTMIASHVFVSVICFAMWLPARNLATSIAFAFLVGGTMGSIWVCNAAIVSRMCGLRKIDVGLSMMWFIVGAFGIVSPVIGIKLRGHAPVGALYDPSQYKWPAVWCGLTYLASAIALWTLRGYLIARDRVAEEQGTAEDNDELHLRVSMKECIRDMFVRSKTRKV